MRLHEDTSVTGFDREEGAVVVRTEWGSVRADRVVLGTGAFRGPLKRLALYTLPVYDHVLMTEPLSRAQLDAVGWQGREGLTDAGNQFHYYRRTLDDRVLFGGYDANYHFPGRIDPKLEQSASHDLLARHFLEIFPQLEGLRFTHRWAGVIDTTTRFTPVFGTALGGRLAYAVGYTGLGVASTRFGARVALDLVDGRDTEVTRLEMVRQQADAVPSRAVPLRRRARHPGEPGGGGPHGQAQPVAARARRGRDRLRQLRAQHSGVERAEVLGHVDGVLAQHVERDDPQHRLVGRGQHDRGRHAVAVGARPVDRGDAPAVARHAGPGSGTAGIGVPRSLPMLRWCSRNSAVTTAQMVWLPRSSGPVLQQPSRKKPVTGSVPQGSSSPPSTLRSFTAPSMPGLTRVLRRRWSTITSPVSRPG